jgi:hypothetical protein
MSTRLRSCASTAVLVAATFANLQTLKAQTESNPKWSVIVFTSIKPEMRADYEAWQKQMSAAYKKAEIPSRTVLQTMMGDLFEYISITPLAKFADMDGASPVERALGKDPAAAFMRKGAAYITSAHRIVTSDMNDVSIHTASDPGQYAVVTIMHLLPAKVPEFTAFLKDEYIPAVKKAEVKNFWVSQTVFGGNQLERVTVRPIKSMSEIDAGPPLRKALGAEGAAKLNAQRASLIDSVQMVITKYRADLSYTLNQPAKTASVK